MLAWAAAFPAQPRYADLFRSAEHAHRAYRCADRAFYDAAFRRGAVRLRLTQTRLFWWPRIVRRDCCRFPRRGSLWPAVRAGTFRRNGRFCFDIRPAVANRPDPDRSPADLRLVAAAQYITGTLLCSSASGDGPQLQRPWRHVERHPYTASHRTGHNRQAGLRRVRTTARRRSSPLTPAKIFPPYAHGSPRRCCHISPSSWRAMRVAV